jgi:hypothetical protein
MRTPDEYAKDWNITKSPKGSEETGGDGGDYDGGVPYRWKDPETKDWSPQNDGASYGHSADCKEVNLAKEAGKDMLTKGYERGEADGDGPSLGTRQPGGSFPQALPKSNEADRTHPYAKECTDTGAYDGTGNDNPHPGTEQIGSTRLPS